MAALLGQFPHLVCTRLRRYPASLFWVLSCAALVAGVRGWFVLMGVLLLVEFAVAVHIANRTYHRRR